MSHKIEYSDSLNLHQLMRLFNSETYALCIKNYKNYEHNNEICEKLLTNKSSSYTYENNIVSHIGLSSYEIDLDEKRFDTYYQNVESSFLRLKNLFSPLATPIEIFQQDFNKIWEKGFKIDSFHGKKMFAGILRNIEKGSAIHAHQDFAAWSNPKSDKIKDIIGQYGINYFLKVPQNGGELLMWDKELSFEEFHTMSKGIFCIPINLLPMPDIVIKPEVGMLVILNANKLHAVAASIDSDRIALSCFLAYRGVDKPLTIWS